MKSNAKELAVKEARVKLWEALDALTPDRTLRLEFGHDIEEVIEGLTHKLGEMARR
jgi:hypothetical protein